MLPCGIRTDCPTKLMFTNAAILVSQHVPSLYHLVPHAKAYRIRKKKKKAKVSKSPLDGCLCCEFALSPPLPSQGAPPRWQNKHPLCLYPFEVGAVSRILQQGSVRYLMFGDINLGTRTDNMAFHTVGAVYTILQDASFVFVFAYSCLVGQTR